MNKTAAKELLDVIMADDYVTRRRMLDVWCQRWLTTGHVDAIYDPYVPAEDLPMLRSELKAVLTKQIFDALMVDEVNVLHWGTLVGNPNSLACEMHVVMQKPREIK